MATVNPESLNVMTREQAEEARRIIDVIGNISNGLGATKTAQQLDQARTDLKALFAAINNDRHPVIQ